MVLAQLEEMFEGREMMRTHAIKQALYDDSAIYKFFRKKFEKKLADLCKEGQRLEKRKKLKDRKKLILKNLRERFRVICHILWKCAVHYKSIYFPDDSNRLLYILRFQALYEDYAERMRKINSAFGRQLKKSFRQSSKKLLKL